MNHFGDRVILPSWICWCSLITIQGKYSVADYVGGIVSGFMALILIKEMYRHWMIQKKHNLDSSSNSVWKETISATWAIMMFGWFHIADSRLRSHDSTISEFELTSSVMYYLSAKLAPIVLIHHIALGTYEFVRKGWIDAGLGAKIIKNGHRFLGVYTAICSTLYADKFPPGIGECMVYIVLAIMYLVMDSSVFTGHGLMYRGGMASILLYPVYCAYKHGTLFNI